VIVGYVASKKSDQKVDLFTDLIFSVFFWLEVVGQLMEGGKKNENWP